jgi:hypothetical protein
VKRRGLNSESETKGSSIKRQRSGLEKGKRGKIKRASPELPVFTPAASVPTFGQPSGKPHRSVHPIMRIIGCDLPVTALGIEK